ncbi:heme oxygenase (biliverdin-producing) [Streptomyces sp. SBT349]|uniref:biliverdin-producing heme oxygenase n=1 Tax=Streptomyces sp. SBT349 TaxID=1580539 RepID=UPI000AA5B725|nr:biliverdin-producing heme oxygenase [Streptomyces sp. SBT349]
MTVLEATPFSTVIRDASLAQHTEARESAFMGDMLGGRLGIGAFRRYTEQLWFVYRALEGAADALAGDPVAGPFLTPALFRAAALERDLDHLHRGGDWRATLRPLPATEAYAGRVREVARDWPGGYVAHHYTRYLGDISGGQAIGATAERRFGFAHRGDGVRFYAFDGIGSPAAFKRTYRSALDRLPVDGGERLRIVDECRRAFTLNTAVFRELGDATRVTPLR